MGDSSAQVLELEKQLAAAEAARQLAEEGRLQDKEAARLSTETLSQSLEDLRSMCVANQGALEKVEALETQLEAQGLKVHGVREQFQKADSLAADLKLQLTKVESQALVNTAALEVKLEAALAASREQAASAAFLADYNTTLPGDPLTDADFVPLVTKDAAVKQGIYRLHNCIHLASISGQDMPFTFAELAKGTGLESDLKNMMQSIVGVKIWERWGPILLSLRDDSHVPKTFLAALSHATVLAGVVRLKLELKGEMMASFEAEFAAFQDTLSDQSRKRTKFNTPPAAAVAAIAAIGVEVPPPQ